MPITTIRGKQVLDGSIQRPDLDITTAGQAVVAKLVQGSGITLSSTGADSGTGDVTVSSPDVVSTDAGNIATLGTDNHILVPQSQIWSVRLRSFNAVGNPTFEVDQKQAGTQVVSGGIDRWALNKAGTMVMTCGQIIPGVLPLLPGTNFLISRAAIQVVVSTVQATLGASDYVFINQVVEGPQFRELSQDVHSLSLLVYSNVANLKFAVALRDPASAKSLVKLCTIPTASVWTLIPLPNLPLWMSGGNFSSAPGVGGYQLSICLASGSTFMAPAADTWQNGNFIGAPGMSNFAGNPVNSQFIAAFIQDEPGALCTTPIDCPFTQNYDDCLRYFTKSYAYATPNGTITSDNAPPFAAVANGDAYGWIAFKKTLAKKPVSISGWSPVSGASNAIRDLSNGVDRTISAVINYGENGFGGFNLSSRPATPWVYSLQYIADTGW